MATTALPRKKITGWAILLGIGLTWGSSYLFIKKGLLHFEVEEVAAIRIALTGLFFLPWMISTWKKTEAKDIPFLLVVALLGSGFPALLFPLAQTSLSSGFTGILSASTPLFTIMLGSFFFKVPIGKRTLLGVLLGFLGIGFLISGAGNAYNDWNIGSAIFILTATCMYAISSNTVNRYLTHLDSMSISSFVFTALSIPAWYVIVHNDTLSRLKDTQVLKESFFPLLALAFMGSFLATLLFFQLIKREGVVFSSTVSYIIPFMAILLAFFDGESIHWMHLAGMLIILTGIYLSRNKN